MRLTVPSIRCIDCNRLVAKPPMGRPTCDACAGVRKAERNRVGRLPPPPRDSVCCRCGQGPRIIDVYTHTMEKWTWDHYPVPASEGGKDLAPAHASCNYAAGAR